MMCLGHIDMYRPAINKSLVCPNVSLSSHIRSKSSFNRKKFYKGNVLNDPTETLEVGSGGWDSSVLSKELARASGVPGRQCLQSRAERARCGRET